MNNQSGLSLIYPVYNEEKNIESAIDKTVSYLKTVPFLWEIIIVDNGSQDGTAVLSANISEKYQNVRSIKLKKKGLGIAIKEGVAQSNFDNFMFYAIDLPFGLEIIRNSFEYLIDNKMDVVIGSKSHKDSVNSAPLKRKVSSFLFNILLNFLFKLDVSDTQGSLVFNKVKAQKIIDTCDSEDAFFCTQLIIYSTKYNYKIKEIPVNYLCPRSDSKINIIRDGGSLSRQLFYEWRKNKK